MPEGDTIYRTATVLRRALAGRVVTGFELTAPRVTHAAAQRRIVGGTVKAVDSNGKHLMITFGTDGEDVVLHTHMRMTGQWHVYRPGERWWFAPSNARVVIRTAEYVAPCETPPIVPDRDISVALLDQRTVSGIGNEIKNEALFLARMWPWTTVATIDDGRLRHVLAVARELLRRNRDGGPRRTRFALDRRQLVWVQERTGRPCYECGTPIERGYHPGEFRKSWYCPSCQPVSPKA
ncbi:MAG: hypothetical protein E6I64_02175 [Chloroflexi bacterium]|nr:MAG: hypothetical protein E6I64_02175 [Chloroflexota bacterium]